MKTKPYLLEVKNKRGILKPYESYFTYLEAAEAGQPHGFAQWSVTTSGSYVPSRAEQLLEEVDTKSLHKKAKHHLTATLALQD